MIECHTDPEHALSDGAQSITPQQLTETMTTLKRIADVLGRSL